MQPKRLGVKFFAQSAIAFDPAAVVPVFQRWIQQHTVEGLLIDVADYKHVYQGPGILLVGHEGDYAYDLRGGRPGLLYTRKQAHQETLTDDLHLAFRLAADACHHLEAEPSLNGIRFDYDQAEIIFLDRLNLPNTPEVFERVHDAVQRAAALFFYAETVHIEAIEPDPRKPLTVRIAALQPNGAR